MDGWTALSYVFVAGAGTLVYLRVVAERITYGERMLARLERRETRSRKRRLKAIRDAELIEAELAGKESAA